MSSTSSLPVRLAVPLGREDHIRGRVEAPVSVVEYGDFECSYCAGALVVLRQIESVLGDEMVLAFRHFPLSEVHPHAELASEAVESAGAQGQFWAMHDMVFENQSDLSLPALLTYAAAVGADPRVVESDLRTRLWRPRVNRDRVGDQEAVWLAPRPFLSTATAMKGTGITRRLLKSCRCWPPTLEIALRLKDRRRVRTRLRLRPDRPQARCRRRSRVEFH